MVKRPIILAGYTGSMQYLPKVPNPQSRTRCLEVESAPNSSGLQAWVTTKFCGGLRLENSWLDKAAWRVMILVYCAELVAPCSI